jgi:hypothetical protein
MKMGVDMAHKVTYEYNGIAKEINFSYSEFRNMHEAVAHAEGVDLTKFLKMEQELEAITKNKHAARNYRDAEFLKMGFSDLYFHKNGGRD